MVDNAEAESAFSSLKNEFYHHHSFTARQEARRGVMRYIEVFYNRWRPHSNNEGLPPATAMAAFTPTSPSPARMACIAMPELCRLDNGRHLQRGGLSGCVSSGMQGVRVCLWSFRTGFVRRGPRSGEVPV